LGVNYLTLGGKATKLRGALIQPGTGKKAPARPQAMFDDTSLITGKAPPDGQSDKNKEPFADAEVAG
jgi:hypothetical protein